MIWSSAKPGVRFARDVDDLMAAEWPLEDLASAPRRPRVEEEPEPVEPEPVVDLAAERAREEAARQAELERARKEAYDRGFEEGRQLGEEREAARLRNSMALTESALEELREGEMRWTGAIEENICALAVAIARQVIGRELREDAEAVMELVKRALAEFPIDQPIRVRVNPMDLQALESCAASEGGTLGITRGREARWISDPRITPGGCVVEGRERIVDGRVDTALERIYRRLTYNHV